MIIIVITAFWLFAGLIGWGLKIHSTDELTVSDLAMLPILLMGGLMSLILTVAFHGDYVIWRRK